jgi:hypothetical protein
LVVALFRYSDNCFIPYGFYPVKDLSGKGYPPAPAGKETTGKTGVKTVAPTGATKGHASVAACGWKAKTYTF